MSEPLAESDKPESYRDHVSDLKGKDLEVFFKIRDIHHYCQTNDIPVLIILKYKESEKIGNFFHFQRKFELLEYWKILTEFIIHMDFLIQKFSSGIFKITKM